MISETLFLTSHDHIWVLDTSALIKFKTLIKIDDQWDAFKRLEELVISGTLRMPNQVIKEATSIAHPDVPGAWASGVQGQRFPPLEPDDSFLDMIMKRVGNVVDPAKTNEDADPYVIALAKQLKLGGSVSVVSNEVVDHSPRISIETACDRLSIPHELPQEFLAAVDINMKNVKS